MGDKLTEGGDNNYPGHFSKSIGLIKRFMLK